MSADATAGLATGAGVFLPLDIGDELTRDLAAIERSLARACDARVTRVDEAARHELLAGGKRARPLLTCTVLRALGLDPAPFIDVAAAVELAHTASLLHDDIIDEARLRRGQEAGHVAFDVPTAILAGDHLVMLALERLARSGPKILVERLCTAVRALCAGEALERERLFDATVDLSRARRVNRLKTASLFMYAAEAGAILAGSGPRVRDAARVYGVALGEAFQTTDDLLDLYGDPTLLGKAIGRDLIEGAVTVPLAIALDRDPSLRDAVAGIWTDVRRGAGATLQLERLRDRMKRLGALSAARRLARSDAARAVAALDSLGASPWREHLRSVARSVVQRRR